MTVTVTELQQKGAGARRASRRLGFLSTEIKNEALLGTAQALTQRRAEILAANRADYEQARESGLSESMLDRMLLDPERLDAVAADVRAVIALPDPVGEVIEARTLPNGLEIARVRVPLGVIGAIFESRPNVTIDISSLALKSGNAVILRGGKEAIRTNIALAALAREAQSAAGVPEGALQLIEDTDRALVAEMLTMKDTIDLLIPRGGAALIEHVRDQAAMPVVAGGVGVCHTYVHASANRAKAIAVVDNAKRRRVSICNALDTVLVDRAIAGEFLPELGRRWSQAGVDMRCDTAAEEILQAAGVLVTPAAPSDFGTEFLALVAAIRVVDSLDEALEHLDRYGSGHSEAIITEDYSAAERFLREVDAAAVYVNASTQFTDGGQYGLGSEVGISTQKMHARGPMGLRELTSYKWIIRGTGQVRP
ncbi:MAG TPA: glutamate-5-semialdehyde dehydrogenase [Dehalococcoidia bacterium]|nr:glutamate-5-semialdehyde dehydrogenase [Dehalococcoidia bacterium]